MVLQKALGWSIVVTRVFYKDKEHGADLQTYKRRDADQTEGGSAHLHDALQVDQILQMDGPVEFRTIREINGVTTTTARKVREDFVTFDEAIGRAVKPPDGIVTFGEEAIVSFGFGGGVFGDGGFGGDFLP